MEWRGHQRWGTRWQSHGTIVKRICCGQLLRTSSISAMRWCGWRGRLIGNFSTAGFPACARRATAGRPCRRGWWQGLFILKHMHNLSDEALCARWLENPYYQFFCGELSFCHQLPFDRSSLTLLSIEGGGSAWAKSSLRLWSRRAWRWRTRLGHWRPGTSSGSWSTPRCSPKRSPIRPTPGYAIAPWKSWSTGAPPGCAIAPELSAGGQARGDHGRALHPCAPVQAGTARTQIPAHPVGTGDPRHPPQDRRHPGPHQALCRAAGPGGAGSFPGPSPARFQDLFAARPRGRMHWQGQGPGAL